MENRSKLTIGYVCESNPFTDRNVWSGTIYKIREAIQMAGYDAVWVPFDTSTKYVHLAERLRWKLYTILGKKQILGGTHFLPEVFCYAKSIKRDGNYQRCDILFFPRGGQVGLFIKTDKPIIYYSDATAFVMVDYYWKNCHPLSVKMACWLEKKASQKAKLNLRSSQWAADSVVRDCKCDPKKSLVLEFGANIDISDIYPIEPYKDGCLQVLFSGVDWDRKGGDIAVETIRLLRELGIDAVLHIVGIKQLPDYCEKLDFVINHGFLNKKNPDSYRKYIDIFKTCHIMLLPTQAECSAIVYCEAAGFGIPTYTYATGGTQNYVLDGVNGYALESSASSMDFANQIKTSIDKSEMEVLHNGALKLYADKLSWVAWAKRFRKIMEENFTSL